MALKGQKEGKNFWHISILCSFSLTGNDRILHGNTGGENPRGRTPVSPKFLRALYLHRNILIHSDKIWYRDTCAGVSSMFFMGSVTPSPRGRGPSIPKKFWNPYKLPNGLTYGDEMWYGITRGRVACFRSVTAPS